MLGPMRPQFVLFGSSIVQFSYYEGWAATLSHLYSRKVDIVLRGYAAWNSRRALQVLDKIFPKNATVQPSLVIVYFGGNDSMRPHPSGLGPHVPLEEYIENMRKIAIHIKSLSQKTRTIFLSTPPINETQIHDNTDPLGQPIRSNESCQIYSKACLELCHKINIKAIDLWSAIQKRDDWRDVCFIDGIHLTVEGSKIVTNEILKVLEAAEWEPSLHWKSMPVEFGEDSPYDPIGPNGKTINVSDLPFPPESYREMMSGGGPHPQLQQYKRASIGSWSGSASLRVNGGKKKGSNIRFCYSGIRRVMLTSKTQRNPRRPFNIYALPKDEEFSSQYFAWLEEGSKDNPANIHGKEEMCRKNLISNSESLQLKVRTLRYCVIIMCIMIFFIISWVLVLLLK